ncbi:MAG TPA: molybdate ABC transporter permease subunit [Caulobacteraceae bacterium]
MSLLTPDDIGAVLLSLKVAGAATVVGLPIALGVAYLLARRRFAGRALVDALVHLPLVLPPVATGYLLLILFGHQGLIGRALESVGIVFAFRWTGAALAAGVMAFPLMVRPIRLSIEAIDSEVDDAARSLGAGRLARLWRVTLPLAGPGLIAGAVLGFARALGEFGATITFVAAIPGETLTLPTAIYQATQTPGGESRALALCAISVVIAVAAVLVGETFSSRAAERRKQ